MGEQLCSVLAGAHPESLSFVDGISAQDFLKVCRSWPTRFRSSPRRNVNLRAAKRELLVLSLSFMRHNY